MGKIFQPEEKVIVNGQEVTILGSKKDFSTNKVSYVIKETGETVSSDLIGSIEEINTDVDTNISDEAKAAEEAKTVSEKYLTVVGKEVPSNKKKDIAWIKAKIEEIELSK